MWAIGFYEKKRHKSFSDTFMDCYFKYEQGICEIKFICPHMWIYFGYKIYFKLVSNWYFGTCDYHFSLADNWIDLWCFFMMTSSNGSIFRVTGHLSGEFTGPGPVNSPHKGQWRGALMFPLICAWINCWVNNRKAGDLRRHLAHYDVSVMRKSFKKIVSSCWNCRH